MRLNPLLDARRNIHYKCESRARFIALRFFNGVRAHSQSQNQSQNQSQDGQTIMLKELWRKLGADFLQTDYSGNECRESMPGVYGSDGFRILPHITHTGELHLERLTSLLKSRYGMGSGAADTGNDDTVLDLITYAARIQDQDIQRELLLFYLNCSPVIQDYLRSDEVLGAGPFLTR
jgi:hypothetical protein